MVEREEEGTITIRVKWWYPALGICALWAISIPFRLPREGNWTEDRHISSITAVPRWGVPRNFKPLPVLDPQSREPVNQVPQVTPPPPPPPGKYADAAPLSALDDRPTCLLYGWLDKSNLFQCAPDSHLWCRPPNEAPRWMNGSTQLVPGPALTWKDIVIAVTTDAKRNDYLEAIGATWARRIGNDAVLVFAGASGMELPQFLRDRNNTKQWLFDELSDYRDLDRKVVMTMREMLDKFPGKRFYMKVDDDTLLIPKNLIRFLQAMGRIVPRSDPVIFGKANCGPKSKIVGANFQNFCHAQGGCYGLNEPAARLLVDYNDSCGYWKQMANHSSSFNEPWAVDGLDVSPYEDVMVARCLREAANLTVLGCESFFPQSPLNYLNVQRDGRVIPNRIRTNPITFHHMSPSAMRYMDEFLHRNGDQGEQFNEPEALKSIIKECRKDGDRMVCGNGTSVS